MGVKPLHHEVVIVRGPGDAGRYLLIKGDALQKKMVGHNSIFQDIQIA